MENKKCTIKNFGYARVSSKEQKVDRQIEAIKNYYLNTLNVEIDDRDIYIDKKSGKDFNREEYKILKRVLRPGDCIVIKEMDRLGRNKEEIKNELEWFRERDITVRILDIPTTLIDYRQFPDGIAKNMMEMVNNILIEVLSTIAEEERRKIKLRQQEGIRIAKAKGKHLGRPIATYPPMWEMYFAQWKSGGIKAKEFMENVNLKKTTFYNLVKKYEEEIKNG